jgi:hypothetical protein
MTLVLGIPQAVLNLVQTGLLERAFHDSLFPSLLFRAEAQKEQWEANTGTELFMTRPGLLLPIVRPMAAGVDPLPQSVSYEQWVARLDRYSGTIDTHMPTSVVANSDLFMRNVQQLGLQAGQSLNRLPRNEMHLRYLSGQTNLTAVTAAVDVQIRVASVNGFTDVITKGVQTRPQPVSSSNPLPITIWNGATAIVRNVIGVDLDNPDDANGPGTLFLSAAVGSIVAARSAVQAVNKPRVVRSGGALSVDGIGASDIFQLQDVAQVVSSLRKNNVPPHEDGTYHCHINTAANNQLFTDPVWQRLHQGTGVNTEQYGEFFIGKIYNTSFYLNNECPDADNSGARVATGTNAAYSEEIGAETTNESGINIGRCLVTGKGCLYEKFLDESGYVTEAGITGKEGSLQTLNAGVEVNTDNIRLILRAPINRTQDVVAATWSITTSFSSPSDIGAGGPERYKRAVVIEHALDG